MTDLSRIEESLGLLVDSLDDKFNRIETHNNIAEAIAGLLEAHLEVARERNKLVAESVGIQRAQYELMRIESPVDDRDIDLDPDYRMQLHRCPLRVGVDGENKGVQCMLWRGHLGECQK